MLQQLKIKAIRTIPNEDVYDITVRNNHNFLANGILVHNCGEIPLQPYGACNLGIFNLYSHVKDKFGKLARLDLDDLLDTVDLAIRALDRMIDINHVPLEEQRLEMINKRQIGLGPTGLADMLCALGIKYSSGEGRIFVDTIMCEVFNRAYETSAMLAQEFGPYPLWDLEEFKKTTTWNKLSNKVQVHIENFGLRNCKLLTCAPTGTTSLLMNNCSSGIEPIFSLEYTRKILNNDGSHSKETVKDLAWYDYKESLWFHPTGLEAPSYFETAQNLSVDSHILMQATIQRWIDNSISKTTNVPIDYPFDDFKEIYIKAWLLGLKGCTTYRPNSIIGSVLDVKKEEKEHSKDIKKQEKEFFSVWDNHDEDKVITENISLPDEYPMRGFKIKSEGKKYYFNVAFKDKAKTKPFAIFVQTNNREGDVNAHNAIELLHKLAHNENVPETHIIGTYIKSEGQSNINKIARMISLLLRHNVKVYKIVKCLDSCEVSVGSFVFRLKKFLMKYVEEIESNGAPCPECGSKLVYQAGCMQCPDCFYAKCS